MEGSFIERLSWLERLMGNPPPGEYPPIIESVDSLRTGLSRLMSIVGAESWDVVDKLGKDLLSVERTVQICLAQQEDHGREVEALKEALAARPTGGEGRSGVRIPEPQSFDGCRDAKALQNFLWDMEQYFLAARVPEKDKVSITAMYLTGDAKLWWRTRVQEDLSAGRPQIDMWDDLKKELTDQFLPCNTSWVAREALKRLKHVGTVRDYVKQFTSHGAGLREAIHVTDAGHHGHVGCGQALQLPLRITTVGTS